MIQELSNKLIIGNSELHLEKPVIPVLVIMPIVCR